MPVDTARLFDGGDPLYGVWLESVIARVHATRKRIAKEQKSET